MWGQLELNQCQLSLEDYGFLTPGIKNADLIFVIMGGALTQENIVRKSHVSSRTIRYALKIIREKMLLIAKMNLQDICHIMNQCRKTPLLENGIMNC